jgi:hypothetical protein
MNVHQAALAWHDAGACVLPAAADGSKRPAGQWDQYKTHRPARSDLDGWVTHAEGIGIVCGTVSGNIEMFEAEAAAVEAGLIEQLMVMLPPGLADKLNTYVERSPKGGVHWIFRVDGVPVKGNTKLARKVERKPGQQTVTVLFETRGEGGWTIAAPSHGRTHPSGKPWQVVQGAAGVIPVLTAEEYRVLHACAATFDTMPERTVAPSPSQTPAMPVDNAGAPGEDFNQRATWEEILIPAGWKILQRRGEVTDWVRPGKNPRDGGSATTGWQGDWFYVFTSSTEFESERTYTKFKTYAVLHHGGDTSAAARALRQAGYGAPRQPQAPALRSVPQEGFVTNETMTVPGIVIGAPTTPVAPVPPTWSRTDLSTYLDGTFEPQVPELLRRSDGHHLLYRGRVHSFHGESESGKSWAALYAAAEAMLAGEDVVMIDFESDAHTVVGRLLLLGLDREVIAARFDYRRPEVSPLDIGVENLAWLDMLGHRYAVAIIDGITEALAVFGVESKNNDEVTGWIRKIPRTIAAKTGAAVIDVDHVTKDADTRGRFAIGGQAKMAALDGAAYVVEVLEPLGVGLVGRISLRVAKDRPGGVRPISGAWRKTDRTQESCVMVIDSTTSGRTVVTIDMPRTETQDVPEADRRPWRPTGYMERVSRSLELANAAMGRNAIAATIAGKKTVVLQAIDYLIEDGYVAADGPSLNGHPSIRLIKPFRDGLEAVPGSREPVTPPDPPSRLVPGSRSNDRGTGGTSLEAERGSREPVGNQSGTSSDPGLFDPEEDPHE